jgi:hypothetical protein
VGFNYVRVWPLTENDSKWIPSKNKLGILLLQNLIHWTAES